MIIIQGLVGWRKERASFYRSSSSSFCSLGLFSKESRLLSQLAEREASAAGLAAMAPVQHLLQLVTSSPGRPAGLRTLCQEPRSALASRGPEPVQNQQVFCASPLDAV